MKSNRNRWTILVVAVWVVALGMTMVIAPTPAEAKVLKAGWMVYTPNHPGGCAPLPYDCYVIFVTPGTSD